MFKQIFLMSVALAAAPVHAQLAPQPDLGLEAARRLADGALQACRSQGRAIAVAVLDRGGDVLVLQRDERVGTHNAEASRRKAYTALSTRRHTLGLARDAQAAPDARNLASMPELLLLGGGIPLLVQGRPAGAIGVAGGGASNDHACALAAVKAVPELDQIQ